MLLATWLIAAFLAQATPGAATSSQSCDAMLTQIGDAARVDQLVRRNWQPGRHGNGLYRDSAMYEIDQAHNALIETFEADCSDLHQAWFDALETDQGNGVWILVQHHADLNWQHARGLPLVERLFGTGAVEPAFYALLADRVAYRLGQPQTYGTQGQCHDGVFVSFPIADEDFVDTRRAALELEPLAERNDRLSRELCLPG